ncbi:MAG: hypothetical protein J6J33_01130 [Clostridia bacterium]|nr:hypothetical protein [Clostridia bacterium]
MAKVYVTYEQIHEYIEAVVKDLESKNIKPTGVYGPPRGGLIYATLLSYRLDIPLLLNAAKGCVIIDDIADSGRTLLHYTENDTQFNKYYITTMFYHERSVVKPDFYVREKKNDWIVFPYEYDN